ncbi:MAG: head-tail joining protein [Phycisphaerae bacterium]
MGDLLRQGSQWLAAQRTAHAASPVTYRRPSTGSGQATELVVSATFGRTEYEVEDDYGLRVGAEVTDFLVAAADFIPTFGEPEAGDRIIADGVAYEVMALAGQGHWRWSDPYRTTLRIHTKEVGTL